MYVYQVCASINIIYDVNIGIGKSTFMANLPISEAYKEYVSEFPPITTSTYTPPPRYAWDSVQTHPIVVPITFNRYACMSIYANMYNTIYILICMNSHSLVHILFIQSCKYTHTICYMPVYIN